MKTAETTRETLDVILRMYNKALARVEERLYDEQAEINHRLMDVRMHAERDRAKEKERTLNQLRDARRLTDDPALIAQIDAAIVSVTGAKAEAS